MAKFVRKEKVITQKIADSYTFTVNPTEFELIIRGLVENRHNELASLNDQTEGLISEFVKAREAPCSDE